MLCFFYSDSWGLFIQMKALRSSAAVKSIELHLTKFLQAIGQPFFICLFLFHGILDNNSQHLASLSLGLSSDPRNSTPELGARGKR